MKKCILMLIVLSLLFIGCARELPDYELPSRQTEQTESGETEPVETKEWEEFNTYPVELDLDPLLGHADHEIVFLQGKYAQYYDVELGRYFAFCSQPNCVHNDESCPSYFGGDSIMETDYVVSGDSVYAVCVEGDTHLRLRQLRPLSGEKTDLFTDTLPEEVHDKDENGTARSVSCRFERAELLLTGSMLILQYETHRDERTEAYTQVVDDTGGLSFIPTGDSNHTGEKIILRYDVKAQTVEELFRGELPIYGGMQMDSDRIVDASDRYALFITHSSLNEPLMTPEEYYQSIGDEAGLEAFRTGNDGRYIEYTSAIYAARAPGEAMLWNLETDDKTPLCSPNDLRMDSVNALYQHSFCYLKDEREIWRCDLKDGSQRKLLDAPGNVGVFEQWDGRLFFNTWAPIDEESALWTWYWFEFATGELRQFHTGLLPFYIKAETDQYFIGMDYNGRYSVLSKQDFYNERYDAAQAIGNLYLVN